MGGIGSTVFLFIQLALYLKRVPDVARIDEGKDPSGFKAAGVGGNPTFVPALRRSLASRVSPDDALVAAAGLLAIAVIHARGHAVGSYGLLPLLSVPFLAAAGLTIGVLVVALRFVRTAWPAAVAALGLLLVEFNGTPMMLAATPLGNATRTSTSASSTIWSTEVR